MYFYAVHSAPLVNKLFAVNAIGQQSNGSICKRKNRLKKRQIRMCFQLFVKFVFHILNRLSSVGIIRVCAFQLSITQKSATHNTDTNIRLLQIARYGNIFATAVARLVFFSLCLFHTKNILKIIDLRRKIMYICLMEFEIFFNTDYPGKRKDIRSVKNKTFGIFFLQFRNTVRDRIFYSFLHVLELPAGAETAWRHIPCRRACRSNSDAIFRVVQKGKQGA